MLLVDPGKVGRGAGPVEQGIAVHGLQFEQLELQQHLDAMAQMLGRVVQQHGNRAKVLTHRVDAGRQGSDVRQAG